MMNKTIVAVGGGGYRMAAKVKRTNLFAEAQLLVCDTDAVALVAFTSHADERFIIKRDNEKETKVKPDDMRELLAQTGDAIILCTTLGGLAGSTCSPIIAHKARQVGKFVCSLFTMPWDFEGRKHVATEAQEALLAASNFAIQQNNERFRAVVSGTCSMNDFKEDQGMLDVLKSVLSSRTLEDWAMEPDQGKLQALVPERYRCSGEPYIELYANGYSALAG